MSKPMCDVCGAECAPSALRGHNGAVGRHQLELINPAIATELAAGKRLVICQEPDSPWFWIHPVDADVPRHRDRSLSTEQAEHLVPVFPPAPNSEASGDA